MYQKMHIGRRSFIKGLGAAGGCALCSPFILPSHGFGADAVSSGNKLNIAVIGAGTRSRLALIPEVLRLGDNITALCDVDAAQVDLTRNHVSRKVENVGAASMAKVKIYDDYRKLLESEKSLDAVIIATGTRWHAPLSVVFMKAGKHVYCEKPLVHKVTESRELVEVARKCKVVTQTGTQGGSNKCFRRSMEIIQAGVLGQIREVHMWCCHFPMYPASFDRPAGEDPIPEGFNWDFWLGPAPYRPFKKDIYHPGSLKYLIWLDFADGMLAGFGSHTFYLPIRALKLDAPIRVDADNNEPIRETYTSAGKFRFDFPARGNLDPVTLWWMDGNRYPPEEVTANLKALYRKVPDMGCLFLGEKGEMYTGGWGGEGLMKMKGNDKWRGVLDHEAARNVPHTLPRVDGDNHMHEWIQACKGGAPTFSSIEVGAKSIESFLPGILSLRLGKPIEWDGANLKARNAPEAAPLIQKNYRTKWLI
ncbi:MAG: hypothetical protein A2283_17330 [Lentisphaerae bacterium RIFOXYA12_FULL_48_11]|nr:MAG: hypothetical protein A2283_17330 [Lentisphaerae bacterium RIFOXYA12_FULL_48_11]